MKVNQKGFTVIEGLLILVIVGILGGVGWYVYSSNKKTNESLDNTGNSQVIPKQVIPKQSKENMPKVVGESPSKADLIAKTKVAIKKAMDGKDYTSLEAYMATKVDYARLSSDQANESASKTEAIQQFNYFGPAPGGVAAKTPWDFNVLKNDTTFAAQLKKVDKTFASSDAYVGRSKDGDSFISFKFNVEGKISSFFYGSTSTLGYY